jgi:hypothetical protein
LQVTRSFILKILRTAQKTIKLDSVRLGRLQDMCLYLYILATNNLKVKIKKTTPLTIALKIIKYLG